MHWKHLFKTSLTSLGINKSRSLLTVMGMIIGVGSITLIMSLGQGAQAYILGQVQGIGSKTIAILPGRQPTSPSDSAQLFSDSLKQKDLDALNKKGYVPEAELVMPIAMGADTASYGNETYSVTIFGATEAMQKILDIYPEKGNFYTNDDVREYGAVIVIGSKLQDKLFSGEDPLGKKLRIKGKNFRIIGILPKKGAGSIISFDEAVKAFPAELRGHKPAGSPHTAWQLLEHLRIAQWDILDFSRNANYQEMKWPGDYWPKTEGPPDREAWDESIARFGQDLEAMIELVSDEGADLFAKIPHGTGQTLLREALLVADHNSYHIGQLVMVRKTLEA